jgi:hypothetical protein
MTEFYAPLNGGIVDLANGASVPPGETVNLTAEDAKDEHNAALIKNNQLLAMDSKKKEGGDK